MSVSRRAGLAGGAVAVVVVLAVALIVVLNSGGDDGSGVRLSAPSYVADPVPKPKTLAKAVVSKRCGVSEATLHTYAPDASSIGDGDEGGVRDCDWYSYGKGSERTLQVDIDRAVPDAVGDRSPDGDALRALDPADAELVAAGDPPRPVGGLGDEALYHYSPSLQNVYASRLNNGLIGGGALLRFRTGAVVVTVVAAGHDLSDNGPRRQISEKRARPAAFAAATDIATALHAPAKPALAPATTAALPPPAPRSVRPCELVPGAVVQRLAAGATRKRPSDPLTNPPGPYGQASDSCEWDATPTCCLHEGTDHRPERHLTVTVYAESEWRRGIAVAQARRLYLEDHDDARAAALSDFHAVRGLGDQAYAAYRKVQGTGISGGEVAFRYRDLVVDVGYYGAGDSTPDEHPLDKTSAVNGAYTAATAVREAL